MSSTYKLISLITLFVMLILVVTSYFFSKRPHKVSGKSNKLVKYNKRCVFYSNFILTRRTFVRVLNQVSSLSVYSQMESRIQSVKFFERALFISGGLWVLGTLLMHDFISSLILLLAAVVILDTTVNTRISDTELETLDHIKELLDSVSDSYAMFGNVTDAIANATVPNALKDCVDKIYSMLTGADSEAALERFRVETPNRILRLFAFSCFVCEDIGDNEGSSRFRRALSYINMEVRLDRLLRKTQKTLFSGVTYLPLVAIPVYALLEFLITKTLDATASVYNGSVGYLMKIVTLILSLACYYVISTVNNSSIARVDDRVRWVSRLMKNKYVASFAELLQPRSYKKRRRLQAKIDACLSQKSIPMLYLEKLIYSIVLPVIGIMLTFVILHTAKVNTFNSLAPTSITASVSYSLEEERFFRDFDAQVLEMQECPDEETLTKKLKSELGTLSRSQVLNHVERIQDKYVSYHNIKFNWWFAFIYIGLYFIGFEIPTLLLQLRASMIKDESELDVYQLQTVIAILKGSTYDTMDVIYWLSKYSEVHKDVLSLCYHSYARDPEIALYALGKKTTSPLFRNMVEKLSRAISDVTIEEVFMDLDADRRDAMQTREMVQTNAIKSKRRMISPLATIPVFTSAILSLLVPVGLLVFRSFGDMSTLLNM